MQSPASLCPVLLWPLVSLLRVTPGSWGCTDGPSSPTQTWMAPGGLRASPLPIPCQPNALAHTNPFIVVPGTTAAANTGRVGTQEAQDPPARTNPTNHQGKGSPEPAGLEPACRGEPGAQERTWEGSLRWGGVTLSLERCGGLERVQPDHGVGRAGPQARQGQSTPCAAAKPGQDPHRPPTFGVTSGPWRVLQWQSHILVPGKLLPTSACPASPWNTPCQPCLLRGHLHGHSGHRGARPPSSQHL